jgi:polyferredoxin
LKVPRNLSFFHPRDWYRKRKQRKKEEMEQALKQKSLRVLTFVVTFIGMALGLSLIPFFVQPVPLIIAFLVSFAAFMNHARSGMALGSLVVGLGLVYQMSRIDLISQISPVPLYYSSNYFLSL